MKHCIRHTATRRPIKKTQRRTMALWVDDNSTYNTTFYFEIVAK